MEFTKNIASQDSDIYVISLPRRVSDEYIAAEEAERQDRMKTGVNALAYGKLFRCQIELMHKRIPSYLFDKSKSGILSVTDSSPSLASSMKSITDMVSRMAVSLFDKKDHLERSVEPVMHTLEDKAEKFAVETNDTLRMIKKYTTDRSHDAIQGLEKSAHLVRVKSNDFAVATNALAADIMDNFTDMDVNALEEKERTHRLNQTVDPLVEGRKHRVENELLHSVKLVN